MQTQYTTYRTLLAPVSGHGLSEAEAKDILRQILPHLSELHDRQQAHGAISLDTVAYDYSRMEIILLDANETNNPIYLAPEILYTRQATPTADIYALGIVIIVLLTGFPPEALKASNDKWNWQELCTVSDQFIQFLNIALFAEPTLRYVNAGQMLRSLQPIINPSESTVTSLANSNGTLLLAPTLLKNLTSKQSSSIVPASSESQSLESLNSAPNYSQKTKKLRVNLSNSKIYRKAKASNDISKATIKGRIRILLATLLGVGVTISGAVGTYSYMQSKSANTAKKNVEFANNTNQSIDQVIARIYEERKSDDDMGKLIDLAKDRYENAGSLSESKTMLQAIPLDSRMRSKADQLLTQWEEDIKKNNTPIKKTDKATKDAKWQVALDTIKVVSLTPYWQWRAKEITEESNQKLPNPNVSPSSPPVVSPFSNADSPHNPTTEIYIPPANPPAETYNPPPTEEYNFPAETYNPPTDRSNPPLPPAPRIAK